MKRLTLTLFLLCAAGAFAYAGTESYSGKDKEVIQQAPAPCEWYRAHEWNFDFWGTWVFSGNPGRFDTLNTDIFDSSQRIDPKSERFDTGMTSKDRLIGRDDTFGGGVDVKYFFNKYFAVGVEGFVLATKTNTAGAGLGTFTFRWPIGCSRFAPYIWGGIGALGGGGGLDHFFQEETGPGGHESEGFTDTLVQNKHTRVDGQLGAGMEVRITPHIGVMTDFAWNFITGKDASNQDFGMVRGGLTLSY
jgi:hypothetical protein